MDNEDLEIDAEHMGNESRFINDYRGLAKQAKQANTHVQLKLKDNVVMSLFTFLPFFFSRY